MQSQITMNLAQLVQLYAPLAGMLMLAFWVGVLSERVKTVIKRVDKIELEDGGTAGKNDRLVRLEGTVATMDKTMEHMSRTMEGINRQLANIATRDMEFRNGKSS